MHKAVIFDFGRVLVNFGDRVKVFHIYVLYARKDFAAQHPDTVRAFLAGWFDSVAWMRDHRDATIDMVVQTAEVSRGVATRDYDELIGMFNRTGRFSPEALNVLSRSFIEMGMLASEPDMTRLTTEKYLPGVK